MYDPNAPKVIPNGLDGEDWSELNDWVYVKSSHVSAIKYDGDALKLYVEFADGNIIVYLGVLPRVALDMYRSRSMGKFVHYRLKHRYNYRKAN